MVLIRSVTEEKRYRSFVYLNDLKILVRNKMHFHTALMKHWHRKTETSQVIS